MTDSRVLRVEPSLCVAEDLAPAADWLRSGGVVAMPTDTFYGLAVDIRSAAAVKQLFALKGRDARAALPLIAADLAQVMACGGRLEAREAALAAAFWPGPLSIVRDAPAWVFPEVHGGHPDPGPSRGAPAVRSVGRRSVGDERQSLWRTER
jgi:L-threonylcarbamoyladenylate synthase